MFSLTESYRDDHIAFRYPSNWSISGNAAGRHYHVEKPDEELMVTVTLFELESFEHQLRVAAAPIRREDREKEFVPRVEYCGETGACCVTRCVGAAAGMGMFYTFFLETSSGGLSFDISADRDFDPEEFGDIFRSIEVL